MKITRVEAVHVALPYEHGAPKPARHGVGRWDTQDILFVKVETDAGLVGWGEAFGNASIAVTIPAISEIVGKLAVGRDPRDRDALMFDLTRRTQSMARSGPVAFALSGLDIALWDLAGKMSGDPLWRMLGGGRRATVPAYASLFRIGAPDLVAKVAKAAVDRGYRRVKLHEHTVEAVVAARSAIGPDIELMVDTNCFWTSVEEAAAFCRATKDCRLTWLEEPLYPADSYDAMADLRAKAGTPIAAGENLGNFNDFRWIIEAGGVDAAQPSVAKIGGVGAMMKAFAYAAARKVRVAPHSPYLGPALIATIHLIAARTEPMACEHRFCDLEASPIGDCVVATDGYLRVPDGPGLGFDVDETIIDKYRVN